MGTHRFLAVLLVAIGLVVGSRASGEDDTQTTEPMPPQLEATIKQFEAIGGLHKYRECYALPSLQFRYFRFKLDSTDADIKKIPVVPFPFGLTSARTRSPIWG